MSVYRITQLSQSEGTDELADRYDAGNQHFSLYHSQTIDFTGICTDYKNVSNSEVFKLFQTSLSVKIQRKERFFEKIHFEKRKISFSFSLASSGYLFSRPLFLVFFEPEYRF
ncbi:hypothetical protein [Desulfosporosinus lacus]|uniref:Uncharacterized protein n=1 Tax=Desulfosporosinus lacus DSM 15449 TaxID=1121420 RepID=A0A1M5Y0K1_9FIRM|nr:hypothetical protein [Desulfosporosinus lacus]SHI05469.1 hypothetical protein SAMN02746098_02166 [Desulfosporosinus lacus DSM 15449]